MANYGRLLVVVGADTSALTSSVAHAATRAGSAASATLTRSVGGAFSSIGRTAGSALTGAGKAVSTTLTGIGTAATGAATAVAGISFAKGFQRLVSIDNATAKLTGLGHSAAETQKIMDNALASVKGTAFGLGDAASQAATMVAAGIKPGQDLTKTLKLTADTATIAGSSLGEVGAIFSKVAAGGKLTTETMQQLQDRGVPVLKFLSDSTHQSMAAVQKNLSAGKISFATFQKAMQQGLGGAALSSGKTFQGALANVQAALGRLGATAIGPAFKQMAPFFQKLIGTIDKLGPAAAKVGDALGKFAGRGIDMFLKLIQGGGKVAGIFDSIKGAIAPLQPLIGPIVAGIGALAGNKLGSALGPLGALLPEISPIVAVLGTMIAQTPELRTAFGGVLKSLQPLIGLVSQLAGQVGGALGKALADLAPVIAGVVKTIIPVFAGIIKAIGPVLPVIGKLVGIIGGALGQALIALAPVIGKVAAILAGLLGDALTAIGPLISDLVPLFGGLVKVVAAILVPILKVAGPLIGAIGKVLDSLLKAIEPLLPPLGQLGQQMAGVVVQAIMALLPLLPPLAKLIGSLVPIILLLMPAITTMSNVLGVVLVQAIKIVVPVLNFVIGILTKLLGVLSPSGLQGVASGVGKAFTAISGFFNKAWVTIKRWFDNVVAWFKRLPGLVVGGLASFGRTILSAVGSAMQRAGQAVSSGIASVVRFLAGLPGKAVSALASLAGKLASAAGSALGRMASAVSTGVGKVVTYIGGLPGKAVDALSNLFEDMASLGADITNGILSGIGDLGHSIANKVLSGLRSMGSKVMHFLGISSPSKWYRDHVGKPIAQGIAVGVAAGAPAISKALAVAVKPPRNAGLALMDDFVKGLMGGATKAHKVFADVVRYANKYLGKPKLIDVRSRVRKKFGPTISGKEAAAAKKLTAQLTAENRKRVAATQAGQRAAVVMAGKLSKTWDRAVKSYTDIGTKVAAQNKVYKKALADYNEYAAGLTANARQWASITSVQASTGTGFIAGMEERIKSVEAFQAATKQLAKLGLNRDTLREILNAGVDQGTVLAQQLAAGGKAAVGKVNTLQTRLNKDSKALGTFGADQFYSAGVASAKGLLSGLQSQQKTITDYLTKLAKAMRDKVKRVLKIRSPSAVFAAEVGAPIAQGVMAGLDSQQSRLDARLRALALPVGHGNYPVGAGMSYASTAPVGGASTGNTVVINPREGMSETQIGRTAARELGWMVKTA